MQPAEARRSERIHYRGQVELLAASDAIEPRSVLGETVDLGAGGIRVAAQAQMAVGAPVTCKLELDGQLASLAGHVAWASSGAAPHGIGICFDALSGADSARLQHLVERSRSGYRAVELRFANLRQPIVARARRRTNGLRLSAALPILARGNELSFRLNEEGPLLTGRIAGAALREDADARRIEVDVDVVDQDGVRFRRNARYGFPNEIERAEELSAAAPAAPAPPPAVVEEQPPRASEAAALAGRAAPGRRSRAWVPIALSAVIGAAAGLATAAVQRRPTSVGSLAAPPQRTAATAEVRAAIAAPPVAPPAANAGPTDPPAQADPVTEVTDSPLDPPALQQPELRVHGRQTRVRIPFEGSLASMRVLLWASPPAFNLYLPDGRVLLPAQHVRARGGSVAGLAFRREGDEQLVRVKLAAKLTHYAVNLDQNTLELSLDHE